MMKGGCKFCKGWKHKILKILHSTRRRGGKDSASLKYRSRVKCFSEKGLKDYIELNGQKLFKS